MNKRPSQSKIDQLQNTSYIHIKHYEDFGGEALASVYISKMISAMVHVRALAEENLEAQIEREKRLLIPIFSLNPEEVPASLRAMYITARGGGIPAQMDFLNQILGSWEEEEEKDGGDPLERARIDIGKMFETGAIEGSYFDQFSTAKKKKYVSALMGVRKELYSYASKEKGIIGEALQAPIRKLDGAINYYASHLQRELEDTGKYKSFLGSLSKILDVTQNGKKWSPSDTGRGRRATRTYDEIGVTLQRSFTGWINQHQGYGYEEMARAQLEKEISSLLGDAFQGKIKSRNVGSEKDIFGKNRKTDIVLDFTLEDKGTGAKEKLSLNFSVKKLDSNFGIQVHHGGSIYSYQDRLPLLDPIFGFMQEGGFEYTFVNELHQGEGFLETFTSMLSSVGYMLLGDEIFRQSKEGTDFFFVKGKIFSLSEVLSLYLSSEDLFNVRTFKKDFRGFYDQKSKLIMKGEDNPFYIDPSENGGFYNDLFISESARIGKKYLYGTSFDVFLKSKFAF